jgi:adenine-specific DNA-methyltransferase
MLLHVDGTGESVSEGPLPARSGRRLRLARKYNQTSDVVLHSGDCLDLLRATPDGAVRLVVTSPPYNIGKEYEKRLDVEQYVEQQSRVIEECVRSLADDGSLCWQVGNYVDRGEIIPLDSLLFPVFRRLGLKMRNRIVWHFGHGLHCSRRFSGRYEVIAWYTKSDNHVFNLDPVRVPQKYPGKKHFKGPKAGQYSCNPKGKNPSDVWVIPNVKHNHVEKTDHPCQFPVEMIERLVLSLTNPGDLVLDPFLGSGTAAVAAVRHGRRAAGAEVVDGYMKIAEQRIREAWKGELRTRPMGRDVHQPSANESVSLFPVRGAGV